MDAIRIEDAVEDGPKCTSVRSVLKKQMQRRLRSAGFTGCELKLLQHMCKTRPQKFDQ